MLLSFCYEEQSFARLRSPRAPPRPFHLAGQKLHYRQGKLCWPNLTSYLNRVWWKLLSSFLFFFHLLFVPLEAVWAYLKHPGQEKSKLPFPNEISTSFVLRLLFALLKSWLKQKESETRSFAELLFMSCFSHSSCLSSSLRDSPRTCSGFKSCCKLNRKYNKGVV